MGTFYHGDCLFVLRHDITPESVDLIYLDPPFFTGKVQKGEWRPAAMEVSYEDSKKFWAEKADAMREKEGIETVPTILLTPQGRLLSQPVALELSKYRHLIVICGHYEGVDERVREHLATDAISIGDYVLSGGELAAMVLVDTIVRLVPGVLGSEDSAADDSYATGLLEYPQYTRPAVYRDWAVPEILLSGNHAQIAKWRREQAILRTLERRPELLDKANLSGQERQLVDKRQCF